MNQHVKQRRAKVECNSPQLSMARQCELLSIHRSGLYYHPVGESALNLELMRLIDEQHLLRPWYGARRLTTWLNKDKGYQVNIKRVRRLMKLLDISAIGPKPNTSKPAKGHTIYPYLLRGIKITRPNQVWAMDITYIPVQGGFLYLVAVIDLYSRYVVNWSLSNTMTADWCKQCLQQAVEQHGSPQIINTDQGSQFTATTFADYITDELKVKLSMDGKGRAIDNIFIERLWRSVKYEQVYLFPASEGLEAYRGLKKYFHYYNNHRRHQSLKENTPSTIYQQQVKAAA